MSQFDIGSGGPGERISKGGIVAPEVPAGPSLSLAAPGVTAAVPNTKGVAMLGQLLTSLDAAGNAANAYSRDQAQKAAHAEHVANVAARNAREIEALQEGQAAEHLGQTLPAMHDEIVNGKWQPDSGQTFEQFVSQKIDAQTAGLSQAHIDYYRKAATPKLLESMYAQQRQARGAIEENGLGTLAARVAGDPTTIASSLEAARKLAPGKSDPDILAAVLLPGAEAAAATGDTATLAIFKEAMGGAFAGHMARLDNAASNARKGQESDAAAEANRAFDSMFQSTPTNVTRQWVAEQKKELNERFPGRHIGDSVAADFESKLSTIDRGDAALAKANEAASRAQHKDSAENQVSALIGLEKYDEARALAGKLAAGIPNGADWLLGQTDRIKSHESSKNSNNARIEQQVFDQTNIGEQAQSLRSGGTVFTVPAEGIRVKRAGLPDLYTSHDDLVAGAREQNFAMFEQEAKARLDAALSGEGSDNPEYAQAKANQIAAEAFKRKAQYIADTGSPWPEMSSVMNSGASLANLESLSRVDKAGNPVVDERVTAGYRAWTSLAGNAELQQRLATDPKAKFLYETTDLLSRNVYNGDIQKSMHEAYRAVSNPRSWGRSLSDGINSKQLTAATADLLGAVGNQTLVDSEVQALALFAMSPAMHQPQDVALKWAAERVKEHYFVLNGYAVPKAGAMLPDLMADAVPQIAADWVKANPKEGYEAGDLTMRPGPLQNTWVLCDAQGRSVDTHLFNTSTILKSAVRSIGTPEGVARRQRELIDEAHRIMEAERER